MALALTHPGTHAHQRTRPLWMATAYMALVFVGSTLPTPLYSTYQKLFGFSPLALTLIYAVYALGNLSALFLLGRISDQVGRRPIAELAIAFGLASTIVFLLASGAAGLAWARALSGVALGLAAGTCAAWIAELLEEERKPLAASYAVGGNMLGLALGALAAGLLGQYARWPLKLCFILYLIALLFLAVLAWSIPETVHDGIRSFRQLSLRPRIGIPRRIRGKFIAPAVTVFDSMALFGFYAAITPTMLAEDLNETSRALSGGLVFELCIAAMLTVVLLRSVSSRSAMLIGLALQVPSVALLFMAQYAHSLAILLLGTLIVGIAVALSYRGSLQVINLIAPAERRAEVVSSYLITGFAGNSLPVIGVGLLSRSFGSLPASGVFACTIGSCAILGLLTGIRSAPSSDSP